MASKLRVWAVLVALLFLMDQLYRLLHPEVTPVRAGLVGASAWLTLRALDLVAIRPVPSLLGGLAVLGSALGSVWMIQAGWLVSRSALSALVHVLLLGVVYLVLEWSGQRLRAFRTA